MLKLRSPKKLLLAILATMLLLAGGVFLREIVFPPLIPDSIRLELDFAPYYPVNLPGWRVDRSTLKFSDKDNIRVLSLVIKSIDNQVTISEQSVPDILADNKGYELFTNKMNIYSEINTINGKVTLTKPVELKGTQTAVTKISQTLIFARPNEGISDDNWRKFFNSLEVIK